MHHLTNLVGEQNVCAAPTIYHGFCLYKGLAAHPHSTMLHLHKSERFRS